MLISPAFAQSAPSGGGGDFFIQLLPFVAILAVIYFLIIRPQQKRAREHREMVAGLRRGDHIVTSGGLIGKVARVTDEHEIMVELAEGVRVRLVRGMVSDVRSRGEPMADTPAEKPRKSRGKAKNSRDSSEEDADLEAENK